MNDQKKRNKKKSPANILDYPLMGVVAFVVTAIFAKWVPVCARLLRQLADTVDKDANAGKKRRAKG